MKPNRARLKISHPPSLDALSSLMIVQSFGQSPRVTSKYNKLMRSAVSSVPQRKSQRLMSRRRSLCEAAGPSVTQNVLSNGTTVAEEKRFMSGQELDFQGMACTSDCYNISSPASLWDSLTRDLQALVLSKLSLLDLITLRCVCQKWNETILSPNFPHAIQHENHSPKCVPLHFNKGYLVVFNSQKNVWEEQPLTFLPMPPESLSLEVSSRGLLCFQDLSLRDFIVCNPITRRWKRVPVPPGITCDYFSAGKDFQPKRPGSWSTGRYIALNQMLKFLDHCVPSLWIYGSGVIARACRQCPPKEDGSSDGIHAYLRTCGKQVVVGIINERNSKNYKLIVAGMQDGDHRGTLLYDSLENLWKKGGDVPRGARFWESGKVVYSHGFFYCITTTIGFPRGCYNLDQPWSVLRYDVEDGVWSQVKIIKKGGLMAQLVEHNGRVLLLQIGHMSGENSNDVTFSELEENSGTMSWRQSKILPLEFFSGEKSAPFKGSWCMGQGHLLSVAHQEHESDRNSKTKGRSLAMLSHDFTLDSWTLLPTLGLQGGYYPTRSLHFIEPSLTVQP